MRTAWVAAGRMPYTTTGQGSSDETAVINRRIQYASPYLLNSSAALRCCVACLCDYQPNRLPNPAGHASCPTGLSLQTRGAPCTRCYKDPHGNHRAALPAREV